MTKYCQPELIEGDLETIKFKIVAGGTPATAMAAVGVPTNRKLKKLFIKK